MFAGSGGGDVEAGKTLISRPHETAAEERIYHFQMTVPPDLAQHNFAICFDDNFGRPNTANPHGHENHNNCLAKLVGERTDCSASPAL